MKESKQSSACKWSSHMKIMNKINFNKTAFDAQESKSHNALEDTQSEHHIKKGKGVSYPEDKCTCITKNM